MTVVAAVLLVAGVAAGVVHAHRRTLPRVGRVMEDRWGRP